MKTVFLSIAVIVCSLLAADPAQADHRRHQHYGYHSYTPHYGYLWEYPGYSYRIPPAPHQLGPWYQPSYYPGYTGYGFGTPYYYRYGGPTIYLGGRRAGIFLNLGR